jgi:cellulose synthase/poly-beta-1,6-N-acetylglucosamine synthase-like glycosyltransferase
VRVVRPKVRIGKTDTQNKALATASGDIIVFTDADTVFDRQFLRRIVRPFSETNVGGVDGHLLFINDQKSGISKSQSYYWKYELRLRELESQLGILAVASGACLAIRKDLLLPMDAEYGEDCIIPLDVVEQGYKMVHASEAFAYDRMEYDSQREFENRVRMTVRNVQGTLSRKYPLNPFRAPGYAFALWSHKLLRWFSPVFLIMLTISSVLLINQSMFFLLFSIALLGFYGSACLGWIAERKGWRIPLVQIAYSFVLANVGFLVGLVRAFLGHHITAYRHG